MAQRRDKVILDYSAPNVAKEMHVGHLRSTIIGDALGRMLECLGHEVVRQNHVGDWGTPFGMLIEHLVDLGQGETGGSDSDVNQLSEFYRNARVKFDGDPAFAERARRRVVLLQAGDAHTLKLWQALIDISKRHFNANYAKLGVLLRDEHLRGESFYNPLLAAGGGRAREKRARADERRRAVRVRARIHEPRRRAAAADRPQAGRRLRLCGDGPRGAASFARRRSAARASCTSSARRRRSTSRWCSRSASSRAG